MHQRRPICNAHEVRPLIESGLICVDLCSPLLSSSACRREGKRARCSGCHSILGRPLRRSRQQPQSPRAQKKERQRLHVSAIPRICLRTLTGASQGSSGRSRQGPPWPGPGPPSPAPGPPASPSRMQRLAVPELTGGASSLLGGRGRELAFAINFLRPIRCHLTRREALRTLQRLLCLSHPSHP